MDLFGINSAHQNATGFSLAFRPDRDSGEADTAETVRASESSPEISSPKDNVMSSHFVHAHQERSAYLSGFMVGLKLQNSFSGQMQSLVSGYQRIAALAENAMTLAGKEMNDADRHLLGMKASKDADNIVDGHVEESNEEKLDEMRRDIDERAHDATASESEKVLEKGASPEEPQEAVAEEKDTVPQAAANAGKDIPAQGDALETPVSDGKEAAPPGDISPEELASAFPADGALPSLDLII
ncbi:hypothetical protein [Pseudodesulfovibrio sp.]|uniref:hypothetical protein n=1 Tax=unclassified Pseudodesulfovibrio TaxID=2661612 RepID=UPI003B00B2D5